MGQRCRGSPCPDLAHRSGRRGESPPGCSYGLRGTGLTRALDLKRLRVRMASVARALPRTRGMSRGRLVAASTLLVALLLAAACREGGSGPRRLARRAIGPRGARRDEAVAGWRVRLNGADERHRHGAPRFIRYENREAAYVVEYPSDWYRAEGAADPETARPARDPRGRHLSPTVGRRPLPAPPSERPRGSRAERRLHRPLRACRLRARPATPKRPQRLSDLLEGISDSGRFCVPDPKRLDTWVPFSDGDRAFYLLVAIGKAAPAETRAQVTKHPRQLPDHPGPCLTQRLKGKLPPSRPYARLRQVARRLEALSRGHGKRVQPLRAAVPCGKGRDRHLQPTASEISPRR